MVKRVAQIQQQRRKEWHAGSIKRLRKPKGHPKTPVGSSLNRKLEVFCCELHSQNQGNILCSKSKNSNRLGA
jgi:hypothetical protein